MSFARVALALVALGCAGARRTPATSPPPAVPAPPAVGDLGVQPKNLETLTAFVEAIGADWGEASRFNGFILVVQHDQPIYARAFGLADREQKRAATADTSFRIGSLTKQFTAAAVLRLEQAGKLSVEDPVGKHLPDFPGPGKEVTIHQLLTHTGGIPSYTNDPQVVARKGQPWTVPALLQTFWSKPLEFPPGTNFTYSNSGYAILGAILERVGGRPYATVLREELFLPAGMTRTVVGDGAGDPDRAVGYQAQQGKLVPADPIDMSLPFAAGAVRSTANDLVRWHRALEGEKILTAQARERLYRPGLGNYAYGWIPEEILGHRAVWHNGGIDGFHADYWRVLDADLVVVVLGNVMKIDTQPIAKAAIAAAFGQVLQPPPQPKRVALDPALPPRLVGTYRITTESRNVLVETKAPPKLIESIRSVTIRAAAEGIELQPVGQDAVRLAPTGPAEFFDPSTNIRAAFELPPQGRATRLTIEQGWLKVIYRR
jgi:CubicO group peptidase (beta-lactamase class C family)